MGQEWVAQYFCPALGTLICNIMWTSPMSAILKVRESGELGNLNPIPFGITGEWNQSFISSTLIPIVINCIGWSLYGILTEDYFIFFSNFFGILLGLFYCMSSIAALSMNKSKHNSWTRIIIESMVVAGAFLWAFVGLIVGVVLPHSLLDRGIFAIGILGCCCGLAYYGSFLSTVREIVRLKNSSSLYLPTLLANLSNASLWVVYGFVALNDPIVWVPNLLGFSLTTFQICLFVIYYPRNRPTTVKDSQEYVLGDTLQSDVQNPLGNEVL